MYEEILIMKPSQKEAIKLQLKNINPDNKSTASCLTPEEKNEIKEKLRKLPLTYKINL